MSNDDDDLFSDNYRIKHPLPTPFSSKLEHEIEEMNQKWRAKTPRKKASNKPEAVLLKKIMKWLDTQGFIHDRLNAGSFVTPEGHTVQLGKLGHSDIIGLYPLRIAKLAVGIYMAIEVKAYPNRPTEKQEAFLARVRSQGGIAIVAYNILDVQQALDAYKKQLTSQLARLLTKR